MQAREILDAVQERTGVTKTHISSVVGVHPVVVGKAFAADRVGLGVAARYLEAMGYKLVAVPQSVHLETMGDGVIAVDGDAPAKD